MVRAHINIMVRGRLTELWERLSHLGTVGFDHNMQILYVYHYCICAALLLGLEATARLSGLVTLLEFSVRSYLVGNAGSRPISEAKQPWACLVLRWGTTGEAHVLYSPSLSLEE